MRDGQPFPVFSFSRLVRAVRVSKGLTQLQAAEAVRYGNYDRWESGSTRVGAQHLAAIGVGFGLGTDDLSLLVFGWLSDRLVPVGGDRVRRLELGVVRKWLAELPQAFLELGEFAEVPPDAASCTEVALTMLLACHGERDACGHWTLRVAPTPRAEVPPADADGGVLHAAYGYAVARAVEMLIRMAQLGWVADPTEAERPIAVAATAMLMNDRVMTEFGRLAIEAAGTEPGADETMDVLGAVGRLTPDLSALGVRVRCGFRRFVEALVGHRVDFAFSERLLAEVAAGDVARLDALARAAFEAGRPIPDPDRRLTIALLDLAARTLVECRTYLVESEEADLVDRAARLALLARDELQHRRTA